MIQLTDKVTALTLPDGATDIFFDGGQSIGFRLDGELRFIHFPKGNWRYICTSKEVTEIMAACIVDSDGNGWKDYNKESIPSCYPFTSSVESLNSLLASKGLDNSKQYVLIEKL